MLLPLQGAMLSLPEATNAGRSWLLLVCFVLVRVSSLRVVSFSHKLIAFHVPRLKSISLHFTILSTPSFVYSFPLSFLPSSFSFCFSHLQFLWGGNNATVSLCHHLELGAQSTFMGLNHKVLQSLRITAACLSSDLPLNTKTCHPWQEH